MARSLTPVASFLKDYAIAGRRDLWLSVFYSVAAGLLTWVMATTLALGMNRVVVLDQAVDDCFGLFVLTGLGYGLRAIAQHKADMAAYDSARLVKKSVTQALLCCLLQQPSPLSDGTGAEINALTEGVEALHGYYALTLPSRVTAVLVPAGLFIAILHANGLAGVILCVTAPLIPLFMIWIGKGADAKTQRQWRVLNYLSGHFLDTIRGIKTLHLFQATRREGELVEKLCQMFRHETMDVLKIAFLSSLVLEFFTTVSIAMIAVLIGFRLLWHDVSFYDGFFVLLLAPEFYAPLRKMGTHYHAKMDALGAAEKLVAIVRADRKEPCQAEHCLETIQTIRLERICFARDGVPVLQNVDLTVSCGDRVILTGASGSGKSTLLLIILGLLTPDSGTVYINDIPLAELDRAAYWRLLGWVPQQTILFPGTVRDNVTLGCTPMMDADYVALLASIGLDSCADAQITTGGLGLSGGQAQRVGVARAIARRPGLLICDEPTAHLDRTTENLVHQALQTHSDQAILLSATHRTPTMALANRRIHLKDGVLQDTGPVMA